MRYRLSPDELQALQSRFPAREWFRRLDAMRATASSGPVAAARSGRSAIFHFHAEPRKADPAPLGERR